MPRKLMLGPSKDSVVLRAFIQDYIQIQILILLELSLGSSFILSVSLCLSKMKSIIYIPS